LFIYRNLRTVQLKSDTTQTRYDIRPVPDLLSLRTLTSDTAHHTESTGTIRRFQTQGFIFCVSRPILWFYWHFCTNIVTILFSRSFSCFLLSYQLILRTSFLYSATTS